MNTKVNKLIKWAAAGLFLVALTINVKVTLDDPFVMLSEQAIATGTGGGPGGETGGGTGGGGNYDAWLGNYPVCGQAQVKKYIGDPYAIPLNQQLASNEHYLYTTTYNGLRVKFVTKFDWVTRNKTQRFCVEGSGDCFWDDSSCIYRSNVN